MPPIADQAQRARALAPQHSFIVQAPAGSGKTELLVRRFLVLLGHVQQPEEILAITFTRKAAAEMRRRIIDALKQCADPGESPLSPELVPLATAALDNDTRHGWQLLRHHRRLRIQTIDSLGAELVQRMPWSSRFGAPPTIVESPDPLYLQAARLTMQQLDQPDSEWADAGRRLLALVDANLGRAHRLLADMLARRDGWLPFLLHGHDRRKLESMWQTMVTDRLQTIAAALPPAIKSELTELAAHSAAQRIAAGRISEHACDQMTAFPAAEHRAIEQWRGLAELVLTQGNQLRGQVNVRNGFPPGQPDAKRRMQALLAQLQSRPVTVAGLAQLRVLPDAAFTDDQWETLEALMLLLPLAVAQLRLLFTAANQADYIELAQRADAALGDSEQPTDLALVLDYRLAHVLVDEFQDTSAAQIRLFEKLTAGWQDGDGRSVFLVGDPMQSIYLFRQAQVSHFLSVQRDGLGGIALEPLALTSNFRSAPTLVDWFNRAFAEIMPSADDISSGAVRYSSASPVLPPGPQTVELHSRFNDDAVQQAEQIADLVAQYERTAAPHSIAVLGRTRAHLLPVAAQLQQRGIAFQAIDLQPLADARHIRDLLTLTMALLQPADRSAWLGLLRAPWCGMTLADITRLAAADQRNITELWHDPARLADLSSDGRQRLLRLQQAMQPALARHRRIDLRSNVEAAWLMLGGAAPLQENQLTDCRCYLELLTDMDDRQVDITADSLNEALQKLWAQPNLSARIRLLTIHGAKGLEFDVVILPQLERSSGRSEAPLLRWTRLPPLTHGTDGAHTPAHGDPFYDTRQLLLVAPLFSSDQRDDRFYRCLAQLDRAQQQNELGRLLYVACTRAKKHLHLFAGFKTDHRDELKPPPQNTLLELLWRWPELAAQAEAQYAAASAPQPARPAADPADQPLTIPRLPLHWQPPALPPALAWQPGRTAIDERVEFSWAGEAARRVGTLLHTEFQQIDAVGWTHWRSQPTDARRQHAWAGQLSGLEAQQRTRALEQLQTALANTRQDARAEWIFSPAQQRIKTEWPITAVLAGRVVHLVIDRSFIDQQQQCWIIDFKFSRHDGKDTAPFLDREQQRYAEKMAQYARAVAALEQRPLSQIRLGLYFPLLNGWRAWPADPGGADAPEPPDQR